MTARSRNLIKAGEAGPVGPRRGDAADRTPRDATRNSQGAADAQPTIVLHRTDDTVDAIEVTCGCGRTIVIQCEYAEEG